MSWHRLPAVLAFAAVAVIGCSASAAVPSSSVPTDLVKPTPTASSDAGTLPVDPSLNAVSLSTLSDGAKEALQLCGLLDSTSLVSGMALLVRPPDAVKYARFYGIEPALQIDGPIWMITTKGSIVLRAGKYVDPTCVEANHEQAWLSTGGRWVADGTWEPNGSPTKPIFRLPPLEP